MFIQNIDYTPCWLNKIETAHYTDYAQYILNTVQFACNAWLHTVQTKHHADYTQSRLHTIQATYNARYTQYRQHTMLTTQ